MMTVSKLPSVVLRKMAFSLRRLSSVIYEVLYVMIVLLVGTTTSVYSDDTLKTLCISVSSLIVDVRPYDLSELSQVQQSNVRHYLDELARSNLKPPPSLHVLQDQVFKDRSSNDTQLHFTLIFSSSNCQSQCPGTVVLPASDSFEIRKFSYHKNIVVQPNKYPFDGNKVETVLGSLILLNENDKSLLAIHDVFNRVAPNRIADRKLEYSRSEYSNIAARSLGADFESYLACLRNVFEVNSPMPGSGAR